MMEAFSLSRLSRYRRDDTDYCRFADTEYWLDYCIGDGDGWTDDTRIQCFLDVQN